MSKDTIEVIDADELDVKEVRCSQTGTAIPAIPNWYASVRVKFVSDAARSKSAAASPYLRVYEGADQETEETTEPTEISLDDVDDDLSVEDIEIDLDDTDLEAEAEEE